MPIEQFEHNSKQLDLLAKIFETLPSPIFYKDIDGVYLGCNKAFAEFIGQTREQILGKTVFDLCSSQSASLHVELDQKIQKEGGSQQYEAKISGVDGEIRNFVIHKATFANNDNEVAGIIGVLTDITGRVKAEEAHKLNEARLEALLELSQMPSGASLKEITDFSLEEAIRLTGSDIGYLAFTNDNESILSMYSWSKKAMDICQVGEKQIDYSVDETGLWGEAIRQRKPVITNDYQAPNPLKHGYPEGHIHIKRHMNIPVFAGEYIVAVAGVGNKETDYDVSDVRQLTLLMQGMWRLVQHKKAEEDKKQLERQLQQVQKMEAIGNLAGGVAHDFNNMLSGIIGAAELLEIALAGKEKELKYIGIIKNAAEQAAGLTGKLLAFSRKGKLLSTPVDLHSIIKDAVAILDRSIDKRVVIQTEFKAAQCMVIGDPSQLQSGILNLCVNARDAMPDGGEIHISTVNTEFDEEYCQIDADFSPGEYIRLTIQDTGTGIPTELQPRVFEPFFTTKEVGKGTGLGLAAVYGMVKEHYGAIRLYSDYGNGTAFHLFLPISQEITSPVAEKRKHVVHGKGNILVVDNEEIVRATASLLLENLGYKVLLAQNGQEAVDIYRREVDHIDLIILDIVMPIMDGPDAFERILDINPNAKVILSSGYAKNVNVKNMEKKGLAGAIAKPFNQIELSKRVADVLSR